VGKSNVQKKWNHENALPQDSEYVILNPDKGKDNGKKRTKKDNAENRPRIDLRATKMLKQKEEEG